MTLQRQREGGHRYGKLAGEPLSAREEEVVALVAGELSNREIAERLVISIKTVEAHVRRALIKTNCRTRVGLGIWWVMRSGVWWLPDK